MIKVGDRVELCCNAFSHRIGDDTPQRGECGTVVEVGRDYVAVLFDKCEETLCVSESEIVVQCATIKDSGDRTEFGPGAVRDLHTGKGRMDLLPWKAIMQVSKHCENGAIKYGEHNVDRGIPAHSLIDSGMRHAAKFIAGETDEDHLVAAVWNFLWLLEMRATHPELMDIPWRAENSEQEEKE